VTSLDPRKLMRLVMARKLGEALPMLIDK